MRRPALQRPGGLNVAHSLQQRCVPDREESTSERRRRLEHSEAEHGDVRERVAGVERTAEGLRAVFDQEHAAALAHLPRKVEVDKTAEQVGHDEDPRAGGQRPRQCIGARRERAAVEVDRHRHQSVVHRQSRHVGVRDGREHHLAAGRQIQRAEQQVEAAANRVGGQRLAARRPEALEVSGRPLRVRRGHCGQSGREVRWLDVEPVPCVKASLHGRQPPPRPVSESVPFEFQFGSQAFGRGAFSDRGQELLDGLVHRLGMGDVARVTRALHADESSARAEVRAQLLRH